MNLPERKLGIQEQRIVDEIVNSFKQKYRTGGAPAIEDYLGTRAKNLRFCLLRSLLKIEFEQIRPAGRVPDLQNYVDRFPQERSAVESAFYHSMDLDSTSEQPGDTDPASEVTQVAPGVGPENTPTIGGGPSASSEGKKVRTLIGETRGDYSIDGELGQGGMGVVYLGRHLKLERHVAIKMIHAAAALDKKALTRFEIEGKAVANLEHPNIVRLYEFGVFDEGPFLTLEYVSGGTLLDLTKETPLPPIEAARIVEKLARAMQFAHDAGILHRDLKPSNILITKAGEPKVSDFGLAKQLVDGDVTGTKTGSVIGTPSFMSPEQARGAVSDLTGATDQYSLGAILYACLSGRPPFMSATTIDTISQVVNKEPIPLRQLSSTVPIDLETICAKTLQKEPDKRYANCEELAEDLRCFIAGEPILARPISSLQRVYRWCRRNPTVAVPSSIAALFFVATAIISSWAWITTSAQAAVIAQERDTAREQRDEADRQKIIANQQKAAADENRDLAEKQARLALENIQFVITDIDSQLADQPAMREIRVAVLDAVSERWDKLDQELVGGIRGEAIPTFMALRQLIAVAYQDLDRLEDALSEFEKLEAMARERVALKGANDATRSNLVKILVAASTLPRRLGNDPAKGISMLQEAVKVADEMIADPQPVDKSPPLNELLQLQGAAAQNLGVEYLRDGRLRDTERAFTKALIANSQVLNNIRGEEGFDELNEDQRDTKTAGLQIGLDKSRIGLAYIRLRLGKTKEALPLYEAAIASRREIYERRPKMLVMQTELAGAIKLFGKSLMWLGRLDEAEKPLAESNELYELSLQADPESVNYVRALAEGLYLLASVRKLQDRGDEALSMFERSRILFEELYTTSPDEKNRINLMLSEAAVGNEEEALEHIDELGKVDTKNAELHLERARALGALAKHLIESEGPKDKIADLKGRALDALDRAIQDGFADPFRIRVEWELDSIRDSDRYAQLLANFDNR